jgi:hypothetical protein
MVLLHDELTADELGWLFCLLGYVVGAQCVATGNGVGGDSDSGSMEAIRHAVCTSLFACMYQAIALFSLHVGGALAAAALQYGFVADVVLGLPHHC